MRCPSMIARWTDRRTGETSGSTAGYSADAETPDSLGPRGCSDLSDKGQPRCGSCLPHDPADLTTPAPAPGEASRLCHPDDSEGIPITLAPPFAACRASSGSVRCRALLRNLRELKKGLSCILEEKGRAGRSTTALERAPLGHLRHL